MKSKSLMLFAALFLVVSLSFAQEKPDSERGPGRRGMMGKLNLTEDQQTKIGTYRLELQKKQIALRAKIQTARIELKEILNAEKIDKASIEKKLSEISKLEIDQKMNFINHWEQVNQMLNPEQKGIWKKTLRMFDSPMRQKMMKRFIRERRSNGPGMRGHGQPQGDMLQFDEKEYGLAMLLSPEFESPTPDDEEYSEITPDSMDEFFEMENFEPEPPDFILPENNLD